MKVLVVEDNKDLLDNISTYLQREGYVAEEAKSYEEAFDKIMSYGYDLVLIDLMLPGGNGLDLLRDLKSVKTSTGAIIISAKDALEDKIEGLELGADDYLTKPFHLSELHARIKAVNRRNLRGGEDVIRVDDLTINTDTREARIAEQAISLTPKEFDLLVYFVTNKNRVLSKQNIAEHLWGDYVDQLDDIDFVYQHIKNLRKKLQNAGADARIESIYGVGYKFKTMDR